MLILYIFFFTQFLLKILSFILFSILLFLSFLLHWSRHYGRSRQYGDRRAQFDDMGSYYRDARGSMYNESNFVFVDPHVLGKYGLFLLWYSVLFLYHVSSCHILSYYSMLDYVMSCFVMSCFIILFYVRLCYIMFRHIMFYHITLSYK